MLIAAARISHIGDTFLPNSSDGESYDEELQDEEPPKKKLKTKTTSRQAWSKMEEDELRSLFSANFKPPRKTPRLNDCRVAINKSKANGGLICHRNWETIKKKVYHMMKKLDK